MYVRQTNKLIKKREERVKKKRNAQRIKKEKTTNHFIFVNTYQMCCFDQNQYQKINFANSLRFFWENFPD